MKQHIFLSSPHMSEEGLEQKYIQEAFDTNWLAAAGENLTVFEQQLAEKTGARRTVALSSGTAAMHMALKAAGVGQGDLVFCQSLTFSATANPILYEKAEPVFIDSELDTWNMDPEALELAFQKYGKEGKTPKAVIVVHLYGICAQIEKIMEICKKYQVPLIEDAAESLGTTFRGRHTGSFGDYGIVSFNGNKIITTSGGGMLLINVENAEEREKKVRFWSTQAREAARWYQHEETGYNYRMSNIVAGIGRGQMQVLEKRIEKKKYIFEYYKKQLADLKDISFMPQTEAEENNCWLSVIQLDDSGKVKPLEIMEALEREDIENRPVWKPLHLQPVFQSYDFISLQENLFVTDAFMGADNSIAGELFRKGVCLPSDTKMTDEDLARVCSIIKSLWA